MTPRKPKTKPDPTTRPTDGHWVTYRGHHIFFPGPAKDADPVATAKSRAGELLARAQALKAARPATTRRAVDNRDGAKPGLVKLTGRRDDGPSMRANDRSWLSSAFYDNYARVSNFLTTPKKTPESRVFHLIAKPLATGVIDEAGELYGVVRYRAGELYDAARHPINTAQELYKVIRHPINATQAAREKLYIILSDPGAVGEAVYLKYDEFQKLPYDEKASIIAHLGGKAAFAVVTGHAILKLKGVAKLKFLSKAERAAAKASTVAPSAELQAARQRIAGQIGELARRKPLETSSAGYKATVAEGATAKASTVAPSAFQSAKQGGKHAGFLKQRIGKSSQELLAEAKTLRQRAAEHVEKVDKRIGFSKISNDPIIQAKSEAGRIKHLQKEIQNFNEQAEIAEELVRQSQGITL